MMSQEKIDVLKAMARVKQTDISAMTALTQLNLRSNSLSGTIPTAMRTFSTGVYPRRWELLTKLVLVLVPMLVLALLSPWPSLKTLPPRSIPSTLALLIINVITTAT